MYKVIMINGRSEAEKWVLRQTHNSEGISACGKYKFYVNEIIPDPDFVVIRGKGHKGLMEFNVAPENLVLTTSEPLTVLAYPKDYCRQFGLVCSCQETLKHKNVIYTPAILPWFAGATFAHSVPKALVDYDTFKSAPAPEKKKLISVVSSNKAFTKGHVKRIEFVEKLKAYYGDKLDVYGRGYNDFDDKLDVVAPYKYHIAIENNSSKYYWTEKLADCFLGESYPIYYGCTNVSDYFPEGSLSAIDVNDFEGAVKIIDALIENDAYEKARPFLAQSKELVLEDYNMFNYIARCLDTLDPNRPRKRVVVKSAKSMHSWHNINNYMIKRNVFKVQRIVSKLFKKDSFIK